MSNKSVSLFIPGILAKLLTKMVWHNLFSCHTHKWSSPLVWSYYQYCSCGLTIYCSLYPHRLFPLRSFSIAVFLRIHLKDSESRSVFGRKKLTKLWVNHKWLIQIEFGACRNSSPSLKFKWSNPVFSSLSKLCISKWIILTHLPFLEKSTIFL